MEVECYVVNRSEATSGQEKRMDEIFNKLDRIKEKLEICKGVGLSAQIPLLKVEIKKLELEIKCFEHYRISLTDKYRILSPEQKEILFWFFNRSISLNNYREEILPDYVLEVFLEASVLPFKDYKVRIYEETKNDPILVAEGHGEIYCLLARWGDALKPWEGFLKQSWKQASLYWNLLPPSKRGFFQIPSPF